MDEEVSSVNTPELSGTEDKPHKCMNEIHSDK